MREPQAYSTTLDLGALGEYEVTVWYWYTPVQRGRFTGPPEDCYPDEPAEVEFDKLTWPPGTNQSISRLDWTDLTEDCRDDLEQSIIEYEEDARAEAYAEAMERSRGHEYTENWP